MRRQKNIILIKKLLAGLIVLVAINATSAFGQSAELTLSSIKTPEEIARWLSDEFMYILEFPDKWQSAEETIRTKKGDCEDFAILTSEILTRQGVKNNIVIVKFDKLGTSHAICIWKSSRGTYNFISNRKLIRTGESSIDSAIEKYYPDWNKIVFTDKKRNNGRVIRRS